MVRRFTEQFKKDALSYVHDHSNHSCLRRSKLSESYRDCLSTNCRIQCLGELPRKEKDPGDRFPRSQNTSWSLYHVTRAHGIGIVTFSGDGDGNHLLPSLHGGAEALR
jgi:hypothetical protein